ncbi:solute carrier family 2, facilitated glucose transporter member 11 [Neomonachus schauinslandi]|uniref:Solute carrier family 2, facilitated glucose transporter member 11 n=1 Tax=Neomonachus schauinslandi TaxID=29088 RepID=A0A2Y9GW75_NEOSC|nr:solute carrier family 2, facilitated glucose transporter member 11 [Neomonachus schauinslandi]
MEMWTRTEGENGRCAYCERLVAVAGHPSPLPLTSTFSGNQLGDGWKRRTPLNRAVRLRLCLGRALGPELGSCRNHCTSLRSARSRRQQFCIANPVSQRMLEKCIQGRVLLLTICAAGIGGTFQFGYNLSIINAPTLHIQEFINETWWVRTGQPLPDHLVLLVWSLIVSLYPLGGLFGALLAGPLAVMLGRKKSLLVNSIFVVAAATLFGFSRRAGSFEMIVLGRLLMGVSTGLSMNVQPMYLGESAPKELRGAVAMTPAIFSALGIVIGQVVGLRELLGDPGAWPLLLASCLVPGVLQLASLPLLPESPRYLLIDRGDTEACLAAMRVYEEGLSHFLYMPFLGVCVWGAICTGFFLPETKGKTFLEISEELHRLNFSRQSQGPEWTGPEVILSTEL